MLFSFYTSITALMTIAINQANLANAISMEDNSLTSYDSALYGNNDLSQTLFELADDDQAILAEVAGSSETASGSSTGSESGTASESEGASESDTQSYATVSGDSSTTFDLAQMSAEEYDVADALSQINAAFIQEAEFAQAAQASDDDGLLAQVEADDPEAQEELALIQTEMEALKKEGSEYFTSFLAQVGIEDSDLIMAQLTSELSSDELQSLVTDPAVYSSLAEMHSTGNLSQGGFDPTVFVQSLAESETYELENILGQLDTEQLEQLSEMLTGVNDGLNLAQMDDSEAENAIF